MISENRESRLEQSLKTLAPERLNGGRRAPERRRSQVIGAAVRIGFILLCLCVLVWCIFTLAENILEYASAQDYYDQLISDIWESDVDLTQNPNGGLLYSGRDYAHSETADYESAQSGNTVENLTWDSDEMTRIRAKLGALYAQNNDLIAWISIPDTIINYPVVLTDNNDYYLNHNFQRDFLIAGTIFADYRNSANLMENYNTVLYGHNVNAGTMFSSLDKYFTKSFYQSHPDIYLYTMDGIYVYRVFNVAKVAATSGYIRTYFEQPDDFVAFAQKMAEGSVHDNGDVTFTGGDRILTLSTCTNAHLATERYCIQAKLVEVRK